MGTYGTAKTLPDEPRPKALIEAEVTFRYFDDDKLYIMKGSDNYGDDQFVALNVTEQALLKRFLELSELVRVGLDT